jgi:hypothetical protein
MKAENLKKRSYGMENTIKNGNIFAKYRPLIVIVGLVILASGALHIAAGGRRHFNSEMQQ